MGQQFVDMDEDSKYEMACNIVKGTGITTISHLQGILIIGYNRAARLIERMEHDGIVSVEDYAGRRALINNGTKMTDDFTLRVDLPKPCKLAGRGDLTFDGYYSARQMIDYAKAVSKAFGEPKK